MLILMLKCRIMLIFYGNRLIGNGLISCTCNFKLSTPPPPPKGTRPGRRIYMCMYADGVLRLELDQGAEKYRIAFYKSLVKTRESNAYRPWELR